MTDADNEIIKALECLCGGGDSCTECAYHKKYRFDECRKQIAKDALDLINRQKAEIERLEKENTVFGEIIKKQDDEISALRKELLKRENLEESFSKSVKQFDKRLEKTVKSERAEAIKEFADRLKDDMVLNIDDTYIESFVEEYIDNLVKEMVGDTE